MQSVAPEKVGFSSDRLKRLDDYMQGMVDEGKLAGISTLLARKGEIFHQENFGQLDLESGRAIQTDSIYRIFSMTKPIASVALMMLHEQAKFRLDDPLSAYIPEFADLTVATGMTQTGVRLESPISAPTVRQLLSHSAGFSYGWFQDTPVDKMYQDAKILSVGSDLESMVSRLAKIPLAYQPGTQWRYSVSTDVVGRLVEVLSGQSFDQYLQERIFEPLGMSDTRFHVPEEDLDRFATVYGPSESGGIEPSDNNFLRNFGRPPLLFSGGGGLVSTIGD
ncbi:MAG: beta-lactamase family protein [Chloroflexi bacterium]|jgi:CubicO group peptidase (beta-lactamase class C family)|nr:beta-lactamase family protein [Chloroflexota bacterium]MBT4072077.1 beta-lactamase family protein [Chloroflexota bacterium]MBT4514250.1 beta-lactamase family protein [Chloroflexota bacterium]MBT5319451.1 beta-lactamase family protein [Chloroflexota bacterium]MBT6682446.1 beta-lactamase family protein [Chloroflexota bacterium]